MKHQKETPLNFSFLESYLCDPEFESDALRLLFAMQTVLKKNKLKVFNNEDIFNFVLMVLCELERLPNPGIQMNIKHKPQLTMN